MCGRFLKKPLLEETRKMSGSMHRGDCLDDHILHLMSLCGPRQTGTHRAVLGYFGLGTVHLVVPFNSSRQNARASPFLPLPCNFYASSVFQRSLSRCSCFYS